MTEPIINVVDATKDFRSSSGVLKRSKSVTRAIDNVNLTILDGEIVGLVGESGSGKTTLGLSMLKLIDLDKGSISFKEKNIHKMNKKELIEFRKKTQMIFQDPYESLNPLLTVYSTVSTSLTVFERSMNKTDKMEVVSKTIEALGLKPAEDFLDKFPSQLSGGERQRVGIARALVLNPEFVVADEAVSMLDVSIRADILNKISDMQKNLGLAMLFVTHDIAVAEYLSNRIAVMHLGQIVEIGAADKVIGSPLHPYTEMLMNSLPNGGIVNKTKKFNVKSIEWERANRGYLGCAFQNKCPFVMDVCKHSKPPMLEEKEDHQVACFLYR